MQEHEQLIVPNLVVFLLHSGSHLARCAGFSALTPELGGRDLDLESAVVTGECELWLNVPRQF